MCSVSTAAHAWQIHTHTRFTYYSSSSSRHTNEFSFFAFSNFVCPFVSSRAAFLFRFHRIFFVCPPKWRTFASASYFCSTFCSYTLASFTFFGGIVCVCVVGGVCERGSRAATVTCCCYWWNINVRLIVYFIRNRRAPTYSFLCHSAIWLGPFLLLCYYWCPSRFCSHFDKKMSFFSRLVLQIIGVVVVAIDVVVDIVVQSVFVHARNQTNDEKWERKRWLHKRRWKL